MSEHEKEHQDFDLGDRREEKVEGEAETWSKSPDGQVYRADLTPTARRAPSWA
jgi:hypothetical protein